MVVDPRIDRLQRIGAASPGVIALGGGLPAAELFPRAALARAFLSVVGAPGAEALQYGWPEGTPGLRAWIAARLRARGAEVSADDVIVTSGAQQALAITASCLLEAGSAVAVDPETYPVALDLFRARGARAVAGVAGVVPNADEVACHYVMPGVGNPRGRAIDAAARAALLATGRPIVADEAYVELRFDGTVPRALLADARDRVWSVGTFSKVLCPGLRLGWLVPPPHALSCALRMKHESDLQAGSLPQALLEELLARDDFDARLARARRFYAKRADALTSALRAELPGFRIDEPEGGFAVWVEAPEESADEDDTRFLAAATAAGVSFDPGRMFRPQERPRPLAFRVCFSAAPIRDLREGARRLGAAWRSFTRREKHAHREQRDAEHAG